ncbi:hypothetical protein HPP92_003580 [Vanilla planifolia]|uniref:Uncharacterized protein n=1 Tax=Vanilla planifolia TaxID=51239 RepID=A0A835SGY4_VANPL|nr:hypothetical protein HPP92_003580 [Vanilla planifolia]
MIKFLESPLMCWKLLVSSGYSLVRKQGDATRQPHKSAQEKRWSLYASLGLLTRVVGELHRLAFEPRNSPKILEASNHVSEDHRNFITLA